MRLFLDSSALLKRYFLPITASARRRGRRA